MSETLSKSPSLNAFFPNVKLGGDLEEGEPAAAHLVSFVL